MGLLDVLRRSLRRGRGERAAQAFVVACIALAVGATTTVFSVVDALLLRPLPYDGADRLVFVRATLDGAGSGRYNVSPANYLAMREGATTFAALEALRLEGIDLDRDGSVTRLTAARGPAPCSSTSTGASRLLCGPGTASQAP